MTKQPPIPSVDDVEEILSEDYHGDYEDWAKSYKHNTSGRTARVYHTLSRRQHQMLRDCITMRGGRLTNGKMIEEAIEFYWHYLHDDGTL